MPMPRSTHTVASLKVSDAAFEEISSLLRAVGYDHAFVDGLVDMSGIALERSTQKPMPDGWCPRCVGMAIPLANITPDDLQRETWIRAALVAYAKSPNDSEARTLMRAVLGALARSGGFGRVLRDDERPGDGDAVAVARG